MVIQHVTNFYCCISYRTLEIGDAVDYLDATGLWENGYICKVYMLGQEFLSHVKIHLLSQGPAAEEWCSVFGGRIMPPGSCTDTTTSVPEPVVKEKVTTGKSKTNPSFTHRIASDLEAIFLKKSSEPKRFCPYLAHSSHH